MKSFAQAHSTNVTYIDPEVVEKALEFIFRLQNPNGTLNNVGIVSHKALQVFHIFYMKVHMSPSFRWTPARLDI